MFYVYVLYSTKDTRFYTGYTSDLRRRVDEHMRGGVKSTSRRSNLKLVFYEAYLSKKDAEKREHYFKTSKGKKTLNYMIYNTICDISNK